MEQMFFIMKFGSRFTDMQVMDNIFKTCCVIYNHWPEVVTSLGFTFQPLPDFQPWRNKSRCCRRRHKQSFARHLQYAIVKSNVSELGFEMTGLGPGDDIVHLLKEETIKVT